MGQSNKQTRSFFESQNGKLQVLFFKLHASSSCYPCLLHMLTTRAMKARHLLLVPKQKLMSKVASIRFMLSVIQTQTLEMLTTWVISNPSLALYSLTLGPHIAHQRIQSYLVIDYLMAALSLISYVKLSTYPTYQPIKAPPQTSQVVQTLQ